MEWIDAENRKPEYDHDVVVVFDDGGIYVAAWLGDNWQLCGHNERAFQKITYWAHFPDVPNVKLRGE
jgi:hypothetical protein